MISVILIGSGNLAYHLHQALGRAPGIELKQVVARRRESLADFDPRVPRATLEDPMERADIFLLAISDAAIGPVARKLAPQEALWVHTAGGMGLEALGSVPRPGVLYPLQTFSRDREVDFRTVPLCIETGNGEDLALLRGLAESLSQNVVELPTAQRRYLHLAAVFINNFTNHLVYLGEAVCREQGLPEHLLRPLLRETLEKLQALSAFEAQTGPARRGDIETQEAHLRLLQDSLRREVYQKISESIHHTYD